MPSTATNAPLLDLQIEDLNRKAAAGRGLSTANAGHLQFLRNWRQHAGKDVVLVFQAKGVLTLPEDQQPPARFVECHDKVAADLLAFAPRRDELCRVATEKEVAQYRDFCRRESEAAKAATALQIQETARAHMQAAVGGVPAITAAEMPAAPVPKMFDTANENTSHAARSAALKVELPDVAPDPATVPAAAPTATIPSELADLVKPTVAVAMSEAGFTTLESVATSTPKDLAKVKGIGEATASRLIVAAGEAMGDGAGDSAE